MPDDHRMHARQVVRRHRALLLLLGLYLVLTAVYSLNTPLFEAPDAYYHFAVIDYIARTGSLPPTADPGSHPWQQAVFHAPLYHAISALLISPVDTSRFVEQYPRNPHAQVGLPDATENHNFVAHTGDPWRESGLAARIVRAFSVILGGVTLASIYALARNVFPARRNLAPLSVLYVLLIPQFLFSSGTINNDNLVVALSSAGLALIAWIVRTGVTWRRVIVLAVLLALTTLAKASGLALYPAAVVALLWIARRDRCPLRRLVGYGLTLLAAWGLLAGWWYARNWQLFGDPTAVNALTQATGARVGPVVDIVGELRGLYYSFWGLFGWFNVRAPGLLYAWVTLLLIVAAIGLLRRAYRARLAADDLAIGAALALHALFIVGSWWQFNRLVLAGQGRLWFPLLGGLACAMAAGLTAWRSRLLIAIGLGGLALFTVSLPWLTIAPAYRPPEQVAVEAWTPPQEAAPFTMRETWLPDPCLTVWVSPPGWLDDRTAYLDVAWQTLCPVTGYWSEFVHLVDPTQESCTSEDIRHILAQYDSMPGGGNLPLPAFRPGAVVSERLTVTLPDGIAQAAVNHVQFGLYDAGGTFVRTAVARADADGDDRFSIRHCASDAINIALEPDSP